jgi:Rps23 Pro-64 3,4-dihydroxylase Tpa1-like proline 4-hydroxylase
MNSIFNPQLFDPAFIRQKTDSFKTAKPYKHIVIDNFLSEDFANTIQSNFPSNDKLSRHYNGLNENKSEGANFDNFHPAYAELRKALSSEEVRKVLEQITGVKDLYTTQDNLGAGVHQGVNGSYLDVHIDFNIHYERNIHRRLNLLIFLNKNWKEEYGGKAEMWNADVSECIQAYLPSFNRCVIFETNEISYHGYSRINIPENESRKSFYCYYYTDINDYKGKYHDTVFKARPEEGTMKKIKTNVKETLKNNIKGVFKKLGIKI